MSSAAADHPLLARAGVVLVSFDIDGTMQFGNPPGPVTVEFVRMVAGRGHVVGSASDRTRSDQTSLWEQHQVAVAFVGGKHHLHEVRAQFGDVDHYVHIGDTDVDAHYARAAGFDFIWVDQLGTIAPDIV
jgi:hypothetical protein